MKKLMIMGAGIYQVPLIRRAKEMGIHTIAVSIPGDYPGFAQADEVCYINTTDQEAVLQKAREMKIDGIVTVGTDVAVITIGRVCDELGLKGISREAARISTDKSLMKECLTGAGVRTAKFVRVRLEEDPLGKIGGMEFPLIVKTVDSSGSRGITRVDRPEEILPAVERVKEVTHKDYYLIEEFITGRDFGAQAFVYDGRIRFILPHGNYMFVGDTGVPAGHYVPYAMSEPALEDLKRQLTGGIRAMGLDNCAVNADLILKDDQTYIVEMTGRGGATGLSELNSIYFGCDMYEQIIRAALGEEPYFPEGLHQPCACTLLKSPQTGVIQTIENRNDPSDPAICEIVLDHEAGDKVHAFRVGPDRIGHVITKGETLEEAEKALARAVDAVRISVLPEETKAE